MPTEKLRNKDALEALRAANRVMAYCAGDKWEMEVYREGSSQVQ